MNTKSAAPLVSQAHPMTMASQSGPPNAADHENNVDCPEEALPYAQCLDPVLHASGELEGFTLEQRQPGAHVPPGPGQQLLPDLDQPPPDHPCRSAISQGRRICVAVGDDCCTEKVLKFAAKYIIKPCDAVTLLHVGGRAGGGPAGPAGGTRSGGSAAARAAAAEAGEPELLCRARATLVQSGKVQPEQVAAVLLPAGGKHVGQALVAHCRKEGYQILITGSRGLKGVKTKLMSLVGEGSVSKHCSENLPGVKVVVVTPPSGHDWSGGGSSSQSRS